MPYLFEEDVPEYVIGFDIDIPGHWKQYDLSGDALARMRAQAVEQYGNRPEEMSALNDLFSDIAQVTNDAVGAGLLSAAGVFEEYDDGFFMATVCVFVFPSGRGDQALEPVRMVENVYSGSATAREGTWLRKVAADLTHTGLGLCGRVFGVTDHDMDDAIVRSVAMHTAFEVPGLDKRVMVSCTSPNSREAEEVLDLFDAITGTARFWEEATPSS
ncbi:hypothetical protein KIK06_20320 [Nocardiopsis sp. EMB25]|uniref:hypothetical protein n=1 Tax=Nocardiopsis TaxID=2013 RepID=UPI0003479B99|nr:MULTISPECIES: hypothetical protein [Nocardiopsis]MCY9786243.1 hypothetical protein [Nocardiopsis sp. EMB25]